MQGFADDVAAGRVSLADAQKQARAALNDMRHGDDGYIAIVGMDARASQNPGRPENDGKDMRAVHDAHGVYIFREIAQLAAASTGDGYLSFLWLRPGQATPSTKLARIATYKPWGWALVSGLYVDDINTAFYDSLRQVVAAPSMQPMWP